MSEEQLKKLNERLAKAEELLKEADPIIQAIVILHMDIDSVKLWIKQYDKYLKTYKK